MTMGGGYIFTASVTASFYQSSEFRVYSSLTRQTDQESPISLSWRATASFYHTGASFGIEGIHLDGSHSLDVAYGVECEEAKSQVQRHRLPVPRLFGLAVTDEGRRRLQWAPSTSSLFFGGIGWGDIYGCGCGCAPTKGRTALRAYLSVAGLGGTDAPRGRPRLLNHRSRISRDEPIRKAGVARGKAQFTEPDPARRANLDHALTEDIHLREAPGLQLAAGGAPQVSSAAVHLCREVVRGGALRVRPGRGKAGLGYRLGRRGNSTAVCAHSPQPSCPNSPPSWNRKKGPPCRCRRVQAR
eukprot:scaffold45461_cov62-Phaeocystis_antarctica.AAC.6